MLGANGVGKSSLFNALEMAYLGKLFSARSRGISPKEDIQYLKNIAVVDPKQSVIIVETSDSYVSSRTSLDSDRFNPISFPAFFCVAYDVEKLARTFSPTYIASQLGFDDYLGILTLSQELHQSYLKRIDSYKEKKEKLERLIKQYDSEPDGFTSTEEFLREKEKVEGRLFRMESKIPLLALDSDRISFFLKTLDYLKRRYIEYLSELMKIGEDVFDEIFSDYRGDDISDVKLKLDEKTIGLNVSLVAKNPVSGNIIGEVLPQNFLNTFRLKIFCVCLKISFAFCCKKIYNINSPIVIDDVFDSSDFQNREKINSFITHVFNAHYKLFGEKSPLQLIFFTQDDMIGDSVFKGICNFSPSEGAKYSRIFNITEAEKQDESVSGIPEYPHFKIINIEDLINVS